MQIYFLYFYLMHILRLICSIRPETEKQRFYLLTMDSVWRNWTEIEAGTVTSANLGIV